MAPERLQLRDAMAVKIQRAFRGWRVRHRVVWQVRQDVALLVADIQRELYGEWALLGSTASFALDWGDGKLRLPRIQDSLFGVDLRFPLEPDDADAVAASVNEQQDATSGSWTPSVASVDGQLDNCQPVGACNVRANGEANTSQGSAGISSASSGRDADASAVETRNSAHQAEPSVQAETTDDRRQEESTDADADSAPARSKDEQRLASVQEILLSHSRDEILLELRWARQALRDRRKVRVVDEQPKPSW